MMRFKKFIQSPFEHVHSFMCAQTIVSAIYGVLIIVMILGMINMKERVEVAVDGTDTALSSSISIAERSNQVYEDINELKSNLRVLEVMQQQIIVRSPELLKQQKEMFSSAENQLRIEMEKELEKLEERLDKLKKGTVEVIPKEKGLKLDLEGLGEYAI